MIKLKDIANITPGYPFRGRITEFIDSNIHVIQMRDVSSGRGINWQACMRTALLGKKKPTWLQAGDILFTARGANTTAVYIDKTIRNYQAVPSPHFFVLRPISDKINAEYLAWLINQTDCQRYFDNSAEGTLAKSIRRSVLEACPIIVPSMDEQQRIVKLTNTIIKENQTLRQLINNNNKLMAAIANKLVTRSKT